MNTQEPEEPEEKAREWDEDEEERAEQEQERLKQEPDFEHPSHQLPSLYPKALLLLCDTCGYWEVVEDVREGRHWRSERTLPCKCQVCYGERQGIVSIIIDDQGLMLMPEEEES